MTAKKQRTFPVASGESIRQEHAMRRSLTIAALAGALAAGQACARQGAGASLQLRSTIDEMRVAGEWACVRGRYTLRVIPERAAPRATRPEADQHPVAGSLRFVAVARHIWNADHPEH
jgi:hypothetical protein